MADEEMVWGVYWADGVRGYVRVVGPLAEQIHLVEWLSLQWGVMAVCDVSAYDEWRAAEEAGEMQTVRTETGGSAGRRLSAVLARGQERVIDG